MVRKSDKVEEGSNIIPSKHHLVPPTPCVSTGVQNPTQLSIRGEKFLAPSLKLKIPRRGPTKKTVKEGDSKYGKSRMMISQNQSILNFIYKRPRPNNIEQRPKLGVEIAGPDEVGQGVIVESEMGGDRKLDDMTHNYQLEEDSGNGKMDVRN